MISEASLNLLSRQNKMIQTRAMAALMSSIYGDNRSQESSRIPDMLVTAIAIRMKPRRSCCNLMRFITRHSQIRCNGVARSSKPLHPRAAARARLYYIQRNGLPGLYIVGMGLPPSLFLSLAAALARLTYTLISPLILSYIDLLT